ncbi:MAG: alpha-glucuronidase [Bacteroidaceae bacterium]|nr:alpha-glucuronidase [Bacteroidaceae bacterium]
MQKTIFTFLMLAVCCLAGGQTYELRLLNHWDNPNGTVERGFAGHSIWKWEEIPAGKGSIPKALKERYEEYGRINKAYGINGTVLNNVNAKPIALSSDMLKKTAKIADVLRPYGIKVYLSVNFASPKALGDLDTADPLDARVSLWWQKKVREIYQLIPDFGGFLVKANSEGEPGPMDYGRTHVDGANMLANALKPFNGIVMWRAFVYSAKGPGDVQKTPEQRAYEGDRANQAYEEFVHFDGLFADNVIIQIKNGPIDFQPREPVSPLFFGLKKTKMMVELQITQEYTGESIHTCFLAPMWREFFDTLKRAQSDMPNFVGMAGVANIGDSPNWTANDLAMANWYAFGRLANDVNVSSKTIAEDFLKDYYKTDKQEFIRPMTQLLLKSREAVVDYMMPLGLHHIFAGGHHYGPEPWYAPRGSREDWLPRFYHRVDTIGIGFNRSDHEEPCLAGNIGSNNVSQYPEPLCTLYNNIGTCPENLILWFHHVSWDETMSNGLSLWDNLCYAYDRGVRQANEFVKTWEAMKPYVPVEQYEEQLWRFQRQAKDSQWWRDACLLYFQTFSHRPLPPDSPAFYFTLEQVMNYHLRMDNYTAADPAKLP